MTIKARYRKIPAGNTSPPAPLHRRGGAAKRTGDVGFASPFGVDATPNTIGRFTDYHINKQYNKQFASFKIKKHETIIFN
jgi:hypothetical protein